MPFRVGRLVVRAALGFGIAVLASGQASRGRLVEFPEPRLLCDVDVPRLGKPVLPADSLDDVCSALAACWQAPPDLARNGPLEITVRFDLDENGLILGTPRHTYAAGVPTKEARASLVRSTIEAVGRCTPVTRTPALRSTMVVNDIALHLVHKQARH